MSASLNKLLRTVKDKLTLVSESIIFNNFGFLDRFDEKKDINFYHICQPFISGDHWHAGFLGAECHRSEKRAIQSPGSHRFE